MSSPEPLWWLDTHHALLLQALPGRPWDQLGPESAGSALHLLGTAIATLHDIPLGRRTEVGPSPMRRTFGRFRRLEIARVRHSAELIGGARPDCAAAALRLAECLSTGTAVQARPVPLHGDCHPKNALLNADKVALIDLDQAGIGPAAADVGSLLARLVQTRLVEGTDTAELTGAFLDGYAEIREVPDRQSLAWHTSAALLAEPAMRAVNRVRPETLDHLGEILDAAQIELRRRVES